MIANSFVWTENDYIGLSLVSVFWRLPYGQIVPSREGLFESWGATAPKHQARKGN